MSETQVRRRPPPRRPRRGIGGGDLGRRIVVAVPAAAYAIFIIASGGWIFAAGILLLGFICLHELFRMYDALRPVKLAGFLALGGFAVAAQEGGERQVLLALVAFIPLMFLIGVAMPRRDGATLTEGMALTVLGVVWIGMAIAHGILLRDLPHGNGIVIDVLVGTFVGDTGAYIGGRWFGTRPLAPRISPNKTVEGLVIGFLTAVVATWAAGLYQDWLTHGQALILGAAVGLVAPIGDLMESAIKRDAGTKDAGSLFGAHGGALDRLDAAFFTLVCGYYVWLAML
jgi:phosphatidate cytidylyltransferase